MTVKTREITLAHSPDSDDAFMAYAIAEKKIDWQNLEMRLIMKDIQTLNQEAQTGTYDISAISFASYPAIAGDYLLTACAGSYGDNYGPVLIGKSNLTAKDLKAARIAIPGRLTTAFMTLQLFEKNLNVYECPFDKIIHAVGSGEYDAGLIIHEGQLTYESLGLTKIVDLGQWWFAQSNLPLPLGGNVIRRALGAELIHTLTAMLKESIVYALANRQEALAYAGTFARDMSYDLADHYVSMYVNEASVDCGERGRQAVELLFGEAYRAGLLSNKVKVEFAT